MMVSVNWWKALRIAVRQFRQLSAVDRSGLREAIKASLAEDDATMASNNRFLLRRPSESGSFEFRVGELRVFYRVVEDESQNNPDRSQARESIPGRRHEVQAVKIENVRAVKARLNRLINDLPNTGSVVITKNGKACAALMLVNEDTDLERLALAQNKRF